MTDSKKIKISTVPLTNKTTHKQRKWIKCYILLNYEEQSPRLVNRETYMAEHVIAAKIIILHTMTDYAIEPHPIRQHISLNR